MAGGAAVIAGERVSQELTQFHLPGWLSSRPDRDFQFDALWAEFGVVSQVPDAMCGSIEQLAPGKSRSDELWLDALRSRCFAAEIGELRPVGKRRKRDHQRSFSTTLHRLLTDPRLGVRGTIDRRVFRSRTFRSNCASRLRRASRRSSSTPNLWQVLWRDPRTAYPMSVFRSARTRPFEKRSRARRIPPTRRG